MAAGNIKDRGVAKNETSSKALEDEMVYLFIILLLIVFAFAWIYFHGIRVKAMIQIDQSICVHVFWDYPFFKATFSLIETVPVIQVYIFNIRILNLKVKKKKRTFNLKRIAYSISATHIRIKTNYGLNNPFQTGIMCGALNILSSFLDIEEITHVPDFMAESDYIRIKAEAFINVRHSILNFAKTKNKKEIYQWSRT